jgi:aryl-alcohol dehydrogenase
VTAVTLVLQGLAAIVKKSATAAILEPPGDEFSLGTVQLDELRADEALVRIEACGICHTDLKMTGRLPLPAVLGHEGTGVIEEVGKGITGFTAGDRVVLSYPWCGHCPFCEKSEPFRCERISALKFGGGRADGSRPLSRSGEPLTSAFFQQSSFATRAIVHSATLVPVQTDLPPELLAPLGCAVQTGAGAILNTFRVGAAEPLVVVGAGAVGLSAILAGRLVGASPLIAIDFHKTRLSLAQELGATHVFNATGSGVAAQVREVMPHGARYVLETSATVSGLNDAIGCVGQGGVVGIVSPPAPGEVPLLNLRGLFERVATLECIVQGSSVPREFIPKLIALQSQGKFPYEKLVTVYDFGEINRAVADARRGIAIKPVLRMPASGT